MNMRKAIVLVVSIPYAFIIALTEAFCSLPQQLMSYLFMLFGWIFFSFIAYKEKKLKEYFGGMLVSIVLSSLCTLVFLGAEKWNNRFLPFESGLSFVFFVVKIVVAIEIVIWAIFLMIKAIKLTVEKVRKKK